MVWLEPDLEFHACDGLLYGRDVGSSDIPRASEARAFEVVAACLSAEVVFRDGSRASPGTPDAELLYPDGRRGWLEVSTLGVQAELELLEQLPRAGEILPSSGPWDWKVVVSRAKAWRRAKLIAHRVVLACEREEVTHPGALRRETLNADAELRWAASSNQAVFFGIKLPAGAKSINPHILFVRDDWLASYRFGDSTFEHALQVGLNSRTLRKEIQKLVAAGGEERHLYLRVTKEGIEEHNFFALIAHAWDLPEEIDDAPFSAEAPVLPEVITHLWLDTEWGNRVTMWQRGVGWSNPKFKELRWIEE